MRILFQLSTLPLWFLLQGFSRPPVAVPCPAEAPTPLADCNENGIEDAVDIAFGTSSDADENGVPDECERTAPGRLDSF